VAYFAVWRFVKYRSTTVDLLVSPSRAFALVGSAILFQAILMRLGFAVANAIASQSTRAPFNESSVWSFTIPFAASSLLLTMLLDRQLSLLAAVVSAACAGLLAAQPGPAILYAFVSCAAAVYGLKKYHERQSVTLAGLFVAAANCIAAMALTAFVHRPSSVYAVLVAGLFGIGGGL